VKYLTGIILLGVMTVVTACNYIPFSGGTLTGKITAPPNDWTQVAQVEIVQLETQPADPYSVNLWVIGAGPKLYVFAGDNRSAWIEHIEVDPSVRLQIGEAIYLLTAQRVSDATEFEAFAQAWDIKYGNRPGNENVAETYLMRLTPQVE